ncbi:hypothetical protein, partial [Neobacillus niacini]|uniref:hypothetical protein n=1 Tax=Neobacillus niacini TaxID=86668 RepID=UPI0028599E17
SWFYWKKGKESLFHCPSELVLLEKGKRKSVSLPVRAGFTGKKGKFLSDFQPKLSPIGAIGDTFTGFSTQTVAN